MKEFRKSKQQRHVFETQCIIRAKKNAGLENDGQNILAEKNTGPGEKLSGHEDSSSAVLWFFQPHCMFGLSFSCLAFPSFLLSPLLKSILCLPLDANSRSLYFASTTLQWRQLSLVRICLDFVPICARGAVQCSNMLKTGLHGDIPTGRSCIRTLFTQTDFGCWLNSHYFYL